MQRLDRILLLRLLAIFGLILTVVALSAVLSQAARLTDEVLRAGMSLSEFGGLILLIVPKMAELVTPLAFGIAVILACVQRNEAGTTLLLRAAGRAPRVDAAVIASGSLAVALVLFACASVLVPLNQVQYRQAFALAQQQGIERLRIPAGQPVELVPGLSLQVEQHREAGVFEGVTVVDLTRPDERLIIRAERAELSRTGSL
ncbi:MAG: LptF/LptG family permease, partial [Pseudomonadota bacterium]|nr:LptF/LptG family permease [Pseudomonadota bacterium]